MFLVIHHFERISELILFIQLKKKLEGWQQMLESKKVTEMTLDMCFAGVSDLIKGFVLQQLCCAHLYGLPVGK